MRPRINKGEFMSDHYILEGHKAVKTDLMTWARRFERTDRAVRKTTIDDVEVSTVFLGLNHQYGDGPPLLFETMIFGGKLDQEQDRCTTWEEAEAMHEQKPQADETPAGAASALSAGLGVKDENRHGDYW